MINPFFSIIMPVYNSGKYLHISVESILNQSFKDFELILVDDGSTDESSKQCDEYVQKDNRVRVIHQKNSGICNARNAALKIARGKYIGFSDHDDKLALDALEKCIEAINKYKYPDMIKFGKRYIFIDTNNKIYRDIEITHEDSIIRRKEIINNYLLLRQQNLFRFVWDGLYKKELIDKYNILFDPYFTHGGEDHDFCNTLSRYIQSVGTLKEIFYYHYLRSNFSTSYKKIPNAGLLHYKIEGERLDETLQIIGYNYKHNKAIYWNQIFESSILPLIRYYLKKGSSRKEILELIEEIDHARFIHQNIKDIGLINLLRQSKKLGSFTYCYVRHRYNLLYYITIIRYKFLKS